ncbi:MAG TPA: hypothetical protein VNJ04_08175 [Gemmatimonadaceae bacterium]|nr:hypothetical protein [Gemmatimonadaceae bacterium]
MTPESALAERPAPAIEPEDPPASPAADETNADPGETIDASAETPRAEATPDLKVGPTESPEVPIHRGTCAHTACAIGVTYRPTASGTGFQVLEVFGCPPDTAFGAGDHGRPLCPHGHGELTIADDLLPAHEAITDAATRAAASDTGARRLPFPAPPFNAEGALHTIQEKRHEIKGLERDFEKADERRKKAKAALDEANTALGQIIDDFEDRELERRHEIERREAAAAAGHPEDTTLVRCAFEALVDGATCPLCTGGVTFVRGKAIAPRASDRHAEQGVEFLDDLEHEALIEALAEAAAIVVVPTAVRAWTAEQRFEVSRYLDQRREGATSLTRPSVFATAHLAAAAADGATVQACRECGATLLVFGQTDEDPQPYAPGTLVGADCTAAEIEPHRYPTPATKKTRARRTKFEASTDPRRPADATKPPKTKPDTTGKKKPRRRPRV